ncbi:unnamed protein product, partial [Meganyctiphanes norvegica]
KDIKMLHKIVLLSIVGVAFGFGPMGNKMMMKYAHKSMMQNCMGPEPIETMMKEFMAACQKCEKQGMNETDTMNIDFQAVINEIRRNAIPWGSSKNSGSNFRSPAQFIPYPVFQPVVGGRMKRQALSASQKLEMMKEKMTSLVGNATCVLKEMGWMNEDKSVNYDTCKEWITKLSVDETLKEDLLYAHDCCKDFSMCMPVEKSKNPIMKELGQSIAYQGCMKMKTTMCCMKQDFKKMALEMGMDNVDTAMDMGMGMMRMSGKEGEPSGMMNSIEELLSGEMMMM